MCAEFETPLSFKPVTLTPARISSALLIRFQTVLSDQRFYRLRELERRICTIALLIPGKINANIP